MSYRRPDISGFYVYQYVRTFASEHGPVGSPYYVGKGHGKRAYKKNDVEIRSPKDKSRVVILAKDLSEDEAFYMEKQLIKFHGRIDLGTGCLRNRTDGGEGSSGAIRTEAMRARTSAVHKGMKHSDAAKAKMSLSRTGTKQSEETKARKSVAQTGKKLSPLSEEYKAKISAFNKGRPKPVGMGAKVAAANRLRKLSEETRAKISSSLTGKKRSDESKAKQSASNKGKVPANKGKTHSEEAKEKMSAAQKLVWSKRHESNAKTNVTVKP